MRGSPLYLLLFIGIIISFSFIVQNWVEIVIIICLIVAFFIIIILVSEQARVENDKYLELQRIKRKYENELKKIDETKNIIIDQLNEFEIKVDNSEYQEISQNVSSDFDEINAIFELQNILKQNDYSNSNNIWELLYDNSEYPYKNPFNEFNKIIKDVIKFPIPNRSIEYEYLEVKKDDSQDLPSLISKYDNSKQYIDYRIEKLRVKYEEKGRKWEEEFKKFEEDKKLKNDLIDSLKDRYSNGEKEAIESYYKSILETATYYKHFSINVVIEYNPINKVLIVEYLLPSIDDFPKIKKRQYIKTRNEFKDIYFSDRELNKIFEDTTYQIVLDIIKKVFVFDSIDQIKTVVFNGWSKSKNKATGLINEACILSVSTNKDEFLKINLPEVDPKECFKGLKGISAHKISNLTPIKPIITINQDDKRFVSAYNVEVDSSTNLASMHWEDFEHLIREIFEKEFTSNGGNVKVTQSSRDGGVDAIAFDPDPIRGGKIVIQAKRYTNVVGVSAVRDLYGTVLNEGATKGILVTTSDYGSDSYNFAKDKPITLLNGSNLLHLLEKHNYKARINIKEAREEINKF